MPSRTPSDTIDQMVPYTILLEQFVVLRNSICEPVLTEISLLRTLLESQSKDLENRLLSFESRLQNVPCEQYSHQRDEPNGACKLDLIENSEHPVPDSPPTDNLQYYTSWTANPAASEIHSTTIPRPSITATESTPGGLQLLQAENRSVVCNAHLEVATELANALSAESEGTSTSSKLSSAAEDSQTGTAAAAVRLEPPEVSVQGNEHGGSSKQLEPARQPASDQTHGTCAGHGIERADAGGPAIRSAFAAAVLSATSSSKDILPANGSMAIYHRREMARKAPACRCCAALLARCGCGGAAPRAERLLRAGLEGVFGISDPNVWVGHPGSRIIHPSSAFSIGGPPENARGNLADLHSLLPLSPGPAESIRDH